MQRVYSVEDVDFGKQEEAPKQTKEELTPQQLEDILIPKYQTAVKLGIDMLDQIRVDEEEDLNQDEIEERPKKIPRVEISDSWSRHPLPAIIGTREFHEDDYCGLYVEEGTKSRFHIL
jgi:hypothetical protein